ncbi:MAG: succinate dehydrogenase, cytochrome b556 subunit [Hyphomicrobium sp.]
MADAGIKREGRPQRPLSPHLQVYSPLINMVMSGIHRITGAALYVGSLLLCWWLIAAATGPEYFDYVSGIFGSWFGRLVLFGYTWALLHHLIGGLRHFIWDLGYGFDLKTIDKLSWGTVILSVVLTLLIWIVVLAKGSGA